MLFWSVVRIFLHCHRVAAVHRHRQCGDEASGSFERGSPRRVGSSLPTLKTALRFSHVWGCCDALLDLHTHLISYIICTVVYSKGKKKQIFVSIYLFFSPLSLFPVHQYLLRAVFLFIAFTIPCNSEITQLMQWLPCSTTVPHKADRNLNGWINADHSSTKTKPEKGRTFLFSDGTKSLLIGWKWQEGVLLNTGPLKCPRLMCLGEVSHPDVFLQV